MKSKLPGVLAIGLLVCFLPASLAAELKPATEIISAVKSATGQKDDLEGSASKTLAADLDQFSTSSKTLPPAEAAARWLQLLEALWKVPVEERYSSGVGLSPAEVIAVLPPPAAWPELSRLIAARGEKEGAERTRETTLRLIAATLQNDRAAQQKQVDALKALYRESPQQMRHAMSAVQQLNEALVQLSEDPKQIRAMIETQIANADRGQLNLPNLVALFGEPAATELLRKALLTTALSFSVQGESTRKLARQIALESIEQLKVPPWSLIDSIESIPLYEALNKRFPAAEKKDADLDLPLRNTGFGDYERRRANAVYLIGLIAQGRTDDAIAELDTIGEEGESFLMALGDIKTHSEELSKFMNQILRKKPELPLWSEFVEVATRAGHSEDMLKLLQETLASENLSDEKKALVRRHLFPAFLAADKIDDALAEMRRLAADLQTSAEDPEQLAELAASFARVGAALEKPELVREGADILRKQVTGAQAEQSYALAHDVGEVALCLAETGQFPAAQELLIDVVKALQSSKMSAQYGQDMVASALLDPLAYLYELDGQPSQVLSLLEKAPWWGIADLADRRFEGNARERNPPLHMLAARALANTDQKAEAKKIVRSILDHHSGYDPAYELFIQIETDRAKSIAYLDELFARDRFEERPLIWKATILHRAGQREEAEKVIRQAIAIDPSDGEQGPGRRMRAYAVLAEIRKGAGDQQETSFLENVSRSIRLSERADKFHDAGMISRALKMYQEALGFFADAYCVQSRLALRMSELGRHDEAEVHYQKAYELMPDSFGRVESHCFGCEAVFGNERAQTVAEKVFTRLVAASPTKPQLHYLLGFLRKEQGNYVQAARHFRDTVKLDPDYLNAWKELQQLSEQVLLSNAEHTAIATNILRLDPLGRHVHPDVSRVTDLAGLYRLAERAYSLNLPHPEKLLALPASKVHLEETRKTDEDNFRELIENRRDDERKPGRIIAGQAILAAATHLLESFPSRMFR